MTDAVQTLTSKPSRRNNKPPYSKVADPNLKKKKYGKGKSKYAKKRNRGNLPAVKPIGPVNDYTSVCCGVPAVKPPCGQRVATANAETGKVKDIARGLGHFRCTMCRKSCKVTVKKHVEVEATITTTTATGVTRG